MSSSGSYWPMAPADRPVRGRDRPCRRPRRRPSGCSELVVSAAAPMRGIERVCSIGAVVGTHSGAGGVWSSCSFPTHEVVRRQRQLVVSPSQLCAFALPSRCPGGHRTGHSHGAGRASPAGANRRRPARARPVPARRLSQRLAADRHEAGGGGDRDRHHRPGADAAHPAPEPGDRRSASYTTNRVPGLWCGSTSATWPRTSRPRCGCQSVASGAPRSTPRSSPRATSWSATTPRRFTPSGWCRSTRASETVSSRRLRTLVAEQLHHAGDRPDAVPAALLSARNLPLRRDALVACHQPRTMVEHAWGRAPARLRRVAPAAARAACGIAGRSSSASRAPALEPDGAISSSAIWRGSRSRSPARSSVQLRDRLRPAPDDSDAPVAAGRCRLGQDRGGGVRPSASDRCGAPGVR